MLRNIGDLRGATIRAAGGAIGEADQFLFDDVAWAIRYLVVDTGGWLTGRLVLISPISITAVDWDSKAIDLALTKAQVENSPDIATDAPLSRQKEREYYQYFGYPPYWAGPNLWGAGIYPGYLAYAGAGTPPAPDPDEEASGDPHLRSVHEVTGYTIQARDRRFGKVREFIVDDETWAIRYLVVDADDLWLGKRVLLPPPWIAEVSWTESTIYVDLDSAVIHNAPEYTGELPINRAYEETLYAYYGRPTYWERERGG
jgi:PRC-barrel domain protein